MEKLSIGETLCPKSHRVRQIWKSNQLSESLAYSTVLVPPSPPFHYSLPSYLPDIFSSHFPHVQPFSFYMQIIIFPNNVPFNVLMNYFCMAALFAELLFKLLVHCYLCDRSFVPSCTPRSSVVPWGCSCSDTIITKLLALRRCCQWKESQSHFS